MTDRHTDRENQNQPGNHPYIQANADKKESGRNRQMITHIYTYIITCIHTYKETYRRRSP